MGLRKSILEELGLMIKQPNLAAFFKGKRVFVTGHTGFKGSWLSLWLTQMGAQVGGYALAPEQKQDFFNVCAVAMSMESTIADLRQTDALRRTINAFKPDIVFHMAAQSLVRRSYQEPQATFEINVLGTASLLEVCRTCPSVRAVLVVTSDKCYENKELGRPFVEGDALGGSDPYSCSKAAAEMVVQSYLQSFYAPLNNTGRSIGLASARAGNVIGGGDWSQGRLIPDFMRAQNAGQPLTVRYPNAVRPWQHVLDSLKGYLLLAIGLVDTPMEYSGAWNFGPSSADIWTVNRVVDALVELWGNGASWKKEPVRQLHEAGVLLLNSQKAKEQLGWENRWHVEEALKKTSEWYKAMSKGQDMANFSREQIQDYTNEYQGASNSRS